MNIMHSWISYHRLSTTMYYMERRTLQCTPALNSYAVEIRGVLKQPRLFDLRDISDECFASSLHDFMEKHPISLAVL